MRLKIIQLIRYRKIKALRWYPHKTHKCKVWAGRTVFRRLRKIAKSDYWHSSCLPVCPSVRIEQLGSPWTNFMVFYIWEFLRKCAEKIHDSLKSDKNNEYVTWIPIYNYDSISLNHSSENKNIINWRKSCCGGRDAAFFSESTAVLWVNVLTIGAVLQYWQPTLWG